MDDSEPTTLVAATTRMIDDLSRGLMNRRSAARLACSLMIGGCAGSCGDSTRHGTETTTSHHRATTLRFLTWLASPEKENFDKVLAAFNRTHPQIEVHQETASGGGSAIINDMLRTQMAAGTPPDLFFMVSGEIAGPFLDAGQILALDASYERFQWGRTVAPWTLNVLRRKSHLFGVPRSARGLGLWYRSDLFARLGLREPSTYDELETLNNQLRGADIYPLSMGGKYGWNTMRLLDYFLEMCCGPKLHDQLNRTETSWACPEVAEAYRHLRKWVEREWIIPGFLAVAPNDSRFPWYRGEAAMLFEGDSLETEIKNDEQDVMKFDFFLPPTGQTPMRFSAYPEQIMISAISAHPNEAIEFLNWYLKSEVQTAYFNELGGATATLGVKPNVKDWPHLAKWRHVLDTGSTYPPTDQVFAKELADAWFEVQDSVASGQLRPELAGERVQAAITRSKLRSKKV